MIPRLALIATLAAFTYHRPELGAPIVLGALFGAWVVWGVGYRTAVRSSGVGMLKGGAFRLRTGRFQ